MPTTRCRWIAALLVFVFALSPAPCPARTEEGAVLEDMVVTNTRDHLLLYLEMKGAFTPDVRRAVESGIATTFSFFITLHQVRNVWFNHEIADITVTHTIKYDTLKKEYLVTRSETPDKPLVTHSLVDAEKAMSRIDGLVVTSLDNLEKGRPYQIKAKAELDRVTLPLGLHYVFFFVSLWDFETDWHTIDFYF
ncbi:MAG: DUF4390 domain-containing protein [Desulfatibacillaceae bacterium]